MWNTIPHAESPDWECKFEIARLENILKAGIAYKIAMWTCDNLFYANQTQKRPFIDLNDDQNLKRARVFAAKYENLMEWDRFVIAWVAWKIAASKVMRRAADWLVLHVRWINSHQNQVKYTAVLLKSVWFSRAAFAGRFQPSASEIWWEFDLRHFDCCRRQRIKRNFRFRCNPSSSKQAMCPFGRSSCPKTLNLCKFSFES